MFDFRAIMGAAKSKTNAAFLIGLASVLFSYAPLIWSLVAYPQYVGPLDWHFSAGMLEAFRKIVRDYGQFPWWNPYSAGGYPYFGSSLTSGAFSLPAALTLVVGPLAALKISVLAFAAFGYVGMVRLAARVTDDALLRVVGGVLFTCNGAIVLHLSVGHLFFDYFSFPWILLFLLQVNEMPRSRRALWSATWGGVLLALACHHIIHYGFAYMTIAIAGLFARGLFAARARKDGSWRSLVQVYGLFASAFLAVGGFRFYLSYLVMRDFPRRERLDVSFDLLRLVRLFVEPGQTTTTAAVNGLGWWEWGCYLGVFAVAVFFFSARKGPTINHLIVAAGVALFLSTDRRMPYYWLTEYVPPFQSMRVAPRIRIWLMPSFAICVLGGLDLLGRQRLRLAHVLAFVILLDVSGNAFYTFHDAFRDKAPPAPAEDVPPNERSYPVVFRDNAQTFSLYGAVRNGYSHTPGYEPSISSVLYRTDPAKWPLKGVNEPGYRGAYYTDAGPVEPTSWSPNRIVFEGVAGPLRVNANPGSYWAVNGEPLSSRLRVSEVTEPFTVLPDQGGRIVLEIVPKGFRVGVLISALAFALTVALFSALHRRFPAAPVPASAP